MTHIEQHTARDGSTFWTAMGGNLDTIRTTRADLDAVLATGDRSIGMAPPLADWPAEYVAAMQARLGLA